MGFPVMVALVVVLGALLVFWARTDREATSAPRVGDHWHSAYDVYVCDTFRSKIVLETDPNGIHSHGDGLIHIHPFNKLASGRDAVLGEFFAVRSPPAHARVAPRVFPFEQWCQPWAFFQLEHWSTIRIRESTAAFYRRFRTDSTQHEAVVDASVDGKLG